MAQNFLYMFEFVVDDLLITRPNCCAPEEYPTCCEISFRSSVFVNICDREFGQCVDMCAPKLGKCCLFSLESPVTDKDRLLIHIYKKKTEKCKFLIGATELQIKPLFDKVTDSFNIENPNWQEALARAEPSFDLKNKDKDEGGTGRNSNIVDNDCDDENNGRPEQFCPTSELTKRLLPLFNLKNAHQTGNIVLIMRLVCNGPTIVSSFPFSRFCSAPCGNKPRAIPPSTPSIPPKDCCREPPPNLCKKPEKKPQPIRRYFSCNADKGCPFEECEDYCDRGELECPKPCYPSECCPQSAASKKKKTVTCSLPSSSSECCSPPRKSAARSQSAPCADSCDTKPCPCCCSCDECCLDECEQEEEQSESDPCLPKKPPKKCVCQVMQPCFITPTRPEPGPEAYEEFEACLNGSGLTIRVLKDTHQVESINDGQDEELDDSGSECDRRRNEESNGNDCDLNEILQKSSFARKYIKRRTGGRIHNNPKLPKIRANIRYAGDDFGCPGDVHVPLSKIRQLCTNRENKLDKYRKNCGDTTPIIPPLDAADTRNCCSQVKPQDIQNALKGINTDARKKGIEVCYKTCNDTDSDVFLVKLGSKQRCRNKKNTIEIELKTPKIPFAMPIQTVTTETQIREAELDAELKGVCGKKKKGKKGKKGKK